MRRLAERVAIIIREFINGIESQIGWTTHLSWAASTLDQRRVDAGRLFSQVPTITELSLLRESRLAPESVESGADFSREPEFTDKGRELLVAHAVAALLVTVVGIVCARGHTAPNFRSVDRGS